MADDRVRRGVPETYAPVYEKVGVELDEILQYVTIFEIEKLIK
jgi:hypothetical protein